MSNLPDNLQRVQARIRDLSKSLGLDFFDTIASLSRISLVMTRSSFEKCSRRSLMNCPEP